MPPGMHYPPRCPQCDSTRYHDYDGVYQCDHCGHTGRGPSPVPVDPNQRTLALDSLARQIVDNLLLEDDPGLKAGVGDFMKSYTTAHPIGPHPASADVDDERMLRAVKVLNKYYLFMWDTFQRHGNHHYLGYRFVDPKGYILFQGTDFGVPQQEAIDSDEVVKGLLRWFLVRPGEGDSDEANFTPQQIEFSDSDDANSLASTLAPDIEQVEKPWVDLPGYEHGDDEE